MLGVGVRVRVLAGSLFLDLDVFRMPKEENSQIHSLEVQRNQP